MQKFAVTAAVVLAICLAPAGSSYVWAMEKMEKGMPMDHG